MKTFFLYIFLVQGFFSSIVAQNTNELALRTKHFNINKKGLALQGFDPVSYFLGKPQKGNPKLAHKHQDITYYFVSSKNLDLFKLSPIKFEPAYGGWCAYAMGAVGEKVEIDPETFKIMNGKLYLFYNATFNNTLPKWNKEETKLNATADSNWVKLYN
jgi:hypothetical protein